MSTAEQHPEAQLLDLRALAAARGWHCTEYVDHGISGAALRRPELERLQCDVHAGRIQVVVVWKFDRFARSVRHLVTALDDFRTRGVAFVSLHDSIDTSTASGRLMFGVIAAFAEFERDVLRERTLAGLAAARRRGRRLGRPRAVFSMSRALELLDRYPLRYAARELGIGVTTLHRKLAEHRAEQRAELGAELGRARAVPKTSRKTAHRKGSKRRAAGERPAGLKNGRKRNNR